MPLSIVDGKPVCSLPTVLARARVVLVELTFWGGANRTISLSTGFIIDVLAVSELPLLKSPPW